MKVSKGDFGEYGPRVSGKDSVIFTFSVEPSAKTVGIILFDKRSKKQLFEADLSREYSVGRVYSAEISGINPDEICYGR